MGVAVECDLSQVSVVQLAAMAQEGRHSAQVVYMQDYQQQPGGAAAAPQVQYTTINMVSEPPKDYIIWSLYSFVYSNYFCLGLAALIFSIKARDRKMLGDLQGAQRYGSTARVFNIVALVLGSTIILTLVLISAILNITIRNTIMTILSNLIKYPRYHKGY